MARPVPNGANGSVWEPDDQNCDHPKPNPAHNPHDVQRQRELDKVACDQRSKGGRA